MRKCAVRKPSSPFPVFISELDSLIEVRNLEVETKYFTLFLAADYTEMNNEEMTKLAKQLIDKGLRYVCCWGEQSTLGDTAFDMGNILWEEQNDTDLHVMTTWHDEPLAEAVWFWLYNGTPDDEFWSQCSAIAVNVSGVAQSSELERLIADSDYLNQAVSDV
ncbi:MAG: hypothetical protein OQJ95_00920 [Kangiella sp.]|jgi:hypothetical protein|nr:hypothetical protein [Kangiella sp.]